MERSALAELATAATPSLIVLLLSVLTLFFAYFFVGVPILLLVGTKDTKAFRLRWWRYAALSLALVLGALLVVLLALSGPAGISPPHVGWLIGGSSFVTTLGGAVGAVWGYIDWRGWLRTSEVGKNLDGHTRRILAVQQGRVSHLEVGMSTATLATVATAFIHGADSGDPDFMVHSLLIASVPPVLLLGFFKVIEHAVPLAAAARRYRRLSKSDQNTRRVGLIDLLMDPSAVLRPVTELDRDAFIRAAELRLYRLTRRRPEPVRGALRAGCEDLLLDLTPPRCSGTESDKALARTFRACVTGTLPSRERGEPRYQLGASQHDWMDVRALVPAALVFFIGLAQVARATPGIMDLLRPLF